MTSFVRCNTVKVRCEQREPTVHHKCPTFLVERHERAKSQVRDFMTSLAPAQEVYASGRQARYESLRTVHDALKEFVAAELQRGRELVDAVKRAVDHVEQ